MSNPYNGSGRWYHAIKDTAVLVAIVSGAISYGTHVGAADEFQTQTDRRMNEYVQAGQERGEEIQKDVERIESDIDKIHDEIKELMLVSTKIEFMYDAMLTKWGANTVEHNEDANN